MAWTAECMCGVKSKEDENIEHLFDCITTSGWQTDCDKMQEEHGIIQYQHMTIRCPTCIMENKPQTGILRQSYQ